MKYAAGIVSQALVSGLNLFIVVYIGANLSPTQLGVYSNIFALALILSGVITTGLTTQASILAAKYPRRAPVLVRATHRVIGAVLVATVSLVMLCALIPQITPYTDVLIATSVFVSGIIIRDAGILALITFGKHVLSAVGMFCVTFCCFLTAIIIHFSNIEPDLGAVLLSIGSINILTFLLLGGFVPLSKGAGRSSMGPLLQLFLKDGRWAISQNIAVSLRNHSYTLIATATITLQAAGELFAARVAVSPLSLVGSAIALVALPEFVRLARTSDVQKYTTRMVGVVAAIALVYGASLTLIVEPLVLQYMPAISSDLWKYVPLWLLVAAVSVFQSAFTTQLRALRDFRFLAWLHIIVALLAIPIAFVAAMFGGAIILLTVFLVAEAIVLIGVIGRSATIGKA